MAYRNIHTTERMPLALERSEVSSQSAPNLGKLWQVSSFRISALVALRFSIALRSALPIYHNIYYAIVTQAGNTDLAADIEGAGRSRNLDRLPIGGDGRRGVRGVVGPRQRARPRLRCR